MGLDYSTARYVADTPRDNELLLKLTGFSDKPTQEQFFLLWMSGEHYYLPFIMAFIRADP
ncbi:hypothetical protein OK016_15395 [Vibrio chagasii]|nr:hypothetical protein [Vibrio chagasii]